MLGNPTLQNKSHRHWEDPAALAVTWPILDTPPPDTCTAAADETFFLFLCNTGHGSIRHFPQYIELNM